MCVCVIVRMSASHGLLFQGFKLVVKASMTGLGAGDPDGGVLRIFLQLCSALAAAELCMMRDNAG